MKKKIVFLALAAAAAIALSGCGGGNEKQAAKADAPIRVGMDASYAPFGSQNVETKEYEGFDVDIIRAIAAEEKLSAEILNINFDGLIPALTTGDLDVVINDMTITDERKRSVDFSKPYYIAGLGIVVREDTNDIKSEKDLAGRRVGVSIGSTGEEAAHKIEGAEVRSYNAITDAFLDLKNGGVDAVVNDLPVNEYYVAKQGKGSLKTVDTALTTEDLGIAVKKGNANMKKKIDDGLAAIMKNGKYTEIYKKWFGKEPPAELLK